MDKGNDERSGSGRTWIYVMEDNIINRVAGSGLIEINLEDYYPKEERVEIDIKNNLYEGLILKEKDFREFIKNNDWSQYKNKFVAITCSADAIVPTWAYMLVAVSLQPFAKRFVFGDLKTLETVLFLEAIRKIDPEEFRDKKIVIKGCGNLPIPESAYVEITRKLSPVAKSIFYGEPCSTVPIMKKKD